jgi:hypothetical protein
MEVRPNERSRGLSPGRGFRGKYFGPVPDAHASPLRAPFPVPAPSSALPRPLPGASPPAFAGMGPSVARLVRGGPALGRRRGVRR